MRRFLLILCLLILALPVLGQTDEAGSGIDVIDVSGPLDASALEFMAGAIESAADSGQELVVLQINSKAVLDESAWERLQLLVADNTQPLPVAIWVGPAPAAAYGAAAALLGGVSQVAISPGSEIGRYRPLILGADEETTDEVIPAEETELERQPTLRQFLQDLDGRTFDTADGMVTVSTIQEFEGGVTVKPVTFRKAGLITRFLRLAVNPEAAFLFLVVGLSMVTFEFFALGPGVASAVAALSLLLGGWGLVTLPVRWWAVGLAIAGWGLLTAAYQKGGFLAMTIAGAVLLQIGGTFFIDGAGQIDPRWWLVLPSVLAVLFFFMVAMPTVQRARLTTQTIGRDSLIGHGGRALVDFDPDGLVEVDGARWRATAHRESGLTRGAEVVVTGVDGLYLEVDRLVKERET